MFILITFRNWLSWQAGPAGVQALAVETMTDHASDCMGGGRERGASAAPVALPAMVTCVHGPKYLQSFRQKWAEVGLRQIKLEVQ